MHAPRPLQEVAHDLGLMPDHVVPYGRGKAKIDLAALATAPRGKGRLILVSAINPTPAGEGKTTTSISLALGMQRRGKNAVLALREPSLGPVFGVKGGGTGGGKAQLVPAEDINLHFTGDIHAITAAHNLLSALIDNALHFKLPLGAGNSPLDARTVRWGRALDMNDRALRDVIVGLGGKTGGVPRQERFDITAASEVMAILALASDLSDLQARLSRIVVGETESGVPVTAGDLGAAVAMTALLRDALSPNLVQTTEGGPAFVHAGPFANIAHGCNSVLATKLAMHYGDYAITEAGFGFDLGGEKFLDIKCRNAGIFPRMLVLVATLRALKMHGGAPVKEAALPNQGALEKGLTHLDKHLETAAFYGLPTVVAVNRFPQDSEEELAFLRARVAEKGGRVALSEGFGRGGEGCLELADVVAEVADATDASPPPATFSYRLDDTPLAKMNALAKTVYGAREVALTARAKTDLARIEKLGASGLPVCMAKTQLSLSDDPKALGKPEDFVVTVREVRLAAGAGFLVALTGDMMTMPGLPRVPAAGNVRIDADGTIRGLMQNE